MTTDELKQRLIDNDPYNFTSGGVEPIVIVDNIIEPYTNYRAFEKDGKLYIPVATYVDGCRDNYTAFEELKQWVNIYGIEALIVGIFSEYMETTEIYI